MLNKNEQRLEIKFLAKLKTIVPKPSDLYRRDAGVLKPPS
jgi:hypothetical protein